MKIYIKGQSIPNPGPGTHGFVCTLDDQLIPDCIYKFPTVEKTDNVKQDMLALIHAIEWAIRFPDHKIQIYTCNGFIEAGYNSYLPKWEERNFHDIQGQVVKNLILWNKISELKKLFKGRVLFKKKIEMPWMIYLDNYLKKD